MAFETFAVHAACIRGVEAIHVTVEVSLAGGVPGIQMLGIPSMEVMESRGRIRCAMRSAGFEIPRSGITVNLAPGDIRKTGSGFDLPIAIAVLAADGQIPRDNLDRCLIAGELGLDGTVLPVKGEVAFQLLARDMGLSFIAGRSDQHVPLAGVDCGFIDHLSQLAHGMGDAARHYLDSEVLEATFEPELDYADVLGQEVAKRGMALAAAGELGLLMIGSPGSGKTMLARRMTGILPELSLRINRRRCASIRFWVRTLMACWRGTGPSAAPITVFRPQVLSAVGARCTRVRSALLMAACSFWTSLLSFPRVCCRRCVSPSNAATSGSYASTGLLPSRRAFSCWLRAIPAPAAFWAIVRYRVAARRRWSSAIGLNFAVLWPTVST